MEIVGPLSDADSGDESDFASCEAPGQVMAQLGLSFGGAIGGVEGQ